MYFCIYSSAVSPGLLIKPHAKLRINTVGQKGHAKYRQFVLSWFRRMLFYILGAEELIS